MATLELNQFSRQIADALFKRFPDWRHYARVEENEHRDEGGILYVEIPAPPQSTLNKPLYILTANEEVVVGFDSDHNHFEDLVENDGSVSSIQEVLDFVVDIIEERVVAVSWWAGSSIRLVATRNPQNTSTRLIVCVSGPGRELMIATSTPNNRLETDLRTRSQRSRAAAAQPGR